MVTFPNAKINLGLNITGKRQDGYHNLESCFYPIPLCDSLEVIQAEKFSFQSYGLVIPGEVSANLCTKAYELISADHPISPVEIHLAKAIPMGAGLGGGSADGAFTLRMLNEIFQLRLSLEELQAYALRLGSDCPFFIENKPVLAKGRGEAFEWLNLDLSGYFLALNDPGIHISTREAFAQVEHKKAEKELNEVIMGPIESWRESLVNDFEVPIFKKHQEIKRIRDEMYAAGATYASMTGSGSTVYGIFEKRPKIQSCQILRF